MWGQEELQFLKGKIINVHGRVRRNRASLKETQSRGWFTADHAAVVLQVPNSGTMQNNCTGSFLLG